MSIESKLISLDNLKTFLSKLDVTFASKMALSELEKKVQSGFGLTTTIVESLDSVTEPSDGILYLIKVENTENDYSEWLYVDGAFEQVGNTNVKAVELVDNLNSRETTKALTANQGYELALKIKERGLTASEVSYLQSKLKEETLKNITIDYATSGKYEYPADERSTVNYKVTATIKYLGNPVSDVIVPSSWTKVIGVPGVCEYNFSRIPENMPSGSFIIPVNGEAFTKDIPNNNYKTLYRYDSYCGIVNIGDNPSDSEIQAILDNGYVEKFSGSSKTVVNNTNNQLRFVLFSKTQKTISQFNTASPLSTQKTLTIYKNGINLGSYNVYILSKFVDPGVSTTYDIK